MSIVRERLSPQASRAAATLERMSREHVDNDENSPQAYRFENSRAAHYSDELTQRAQLRWWAEQMERP